MQNNFYTFKKKSNSRFILALLFGNSNLIAANQFKGHFVDQYG